MIFVSMLTVAGHLENSKILENCFTPSPPPNHPTSMFQSGHFSKMGTPYPHLDQD